MYSILRAQFSMLSLFCDQQYIQYVMTLCHVLLHLLYTWCKAGQGTFQYHKTANKINVLLHVNIDLSDRDLIYVTVGGGGEL